MAHIAKYKTASCGHMLAHYRRDKGSLGRENIDPNRTKDNYTLGLDECDGKVRALKGIEPNWATVEGRIERVNEAAKAAGKRATRKDAVVMADVVVTLPENVHKADEGKFFGYTYWFLIRKLGKENMMGGFVHKDEVRKDGSPVRDHMHVPFTPIKDGRFNYKQMCPRSFYQGLHKELGDYLEKRMGYRPEIELGEETRAQRVYTDKSVDIDKVRGAVDRAVVQPAEDEAVRIVAAAKEEAAALLSEAETRKAELVTQIADKEGDLAELDSQLEDVKLDIEDEQDRLECLRQRANGVARDVGELRPIAAEVRGWEAAGKAERGAILDRVAAQCDGLAGRIRTAVAGIKLKVEELRSRISRPLEYLMRREQPRRQSFDDMLRDAQRAADAWNRDHAAPQRTYRGRAR
ncbi:plasmid recombination protein [Bifidobacterium angulatum]|uniref:plasmid recombination protein n=1 Tax=Bifidobacterium angulatum TaxID=1683 RepID=UPI003AB82516